jgi:hypothetical protein
MIVLNETCRPVKTAVSTLENISRKAPKTHLWVTEYPNYDTTQQLRKVKLSGNLCFCNHLKARTYMMDHLWKLGN